ncbi:MAG: hypothetical protein IPO18_08375 [bacterium]|nr:hypothetical protein [bacterium]
MDGFLTQMETDEGDAVTYGANRAFYPFSSHRGAGGHGAGAGASEEQAGVAQYELMLDGLAELEGTHRGDEGTEDEGTLPRRGDSRVPRPVHPVVGRHRPSWSSQEALKQRRREEYHVVYRRPRSSSRWWSPPGVLAQDWGKTEDYAKPEMKQLAESLATISPAGGHQEGQPAAGETLLSGSTATPRSPCC